MPRWDAEQSQSPGWDAELSQRRCGRRRWGCSSPRSARSGPARGTTSRTTRYLRGHATALRDCDCGAVLMHRARGKQAARRARGDQDGAPPARRGVGQPHPRAGDYCQLGVPTVLVLRQLSVGARGQTCTYDVNLPAGEPISGTSCQEPAAGAAVAAGVANCPSRSDSASKFTQAICRFACDF